MTPLYSLLSVSECRTIFSLYYSTEHTSPFWSYIRNIWYYIWDRSFYIGPHILCQQLYQSAITYSHILAFWYNVADILSSPHETFYTTLNISSTIHKWRADLLLHAFSSCIPSGIWKLSVLIHEFGKYIIGLKISTAFPLLSCFKIHHILPFVIHYFWI